MTFEGGVPGTAQLSPPTSSPPPQGPAASQHKAKAYNRIKLIVGVCSSALSFSLLLGLVVSGQTRSIETWIRALVTHDYLALSLFAFTVGLMQTALTLPLSFYSGYVVEHRYALSNQSLGRWAWEQLKGVLVSLPLAIAVLAFLFFCLRQYGGWWWLPVAAALSLLSIILARVVPVLVFPLFYKFTPLDNEPLKGRILRLCSDAGVHINGIFSFNLSKNTRKANAAFTGIGKAKRIILSDTLLGNFSEEEIETIFTHELGHYTHKHLLTGIVVGMLSIFVGLSVTARLYGWSLGLFGFTSIDQVAALPLLALWLSLFGLITTPLGNMLSRHHERVADAYAVRRTGRAAAFISALRRLEQMNLADPSPHPLVEFLFYSHPSISRRIHAVESLAR